MAPSALPAPTTVCSSSTKQDHLSFLLGQIVEHALQSLLELAAELGACNQRAHVERQDALALEALRHLALTMRCARPSTMAVLADARLADQHRVVFGTPLQHLDGAADLIVAADHRVELAGSRARGEIDGCTSRAPGGLPRRWHRILLAAAHFLDSLLHGTAHDARLLEQARERAILEGRQHEQLTRYELVAALLRQLVR